MSESKTKRFQNFANFQESISLRESVEGEAKEIEQEIDPEEIEKIDPDKVAATLSALIDAGGDLDKIDMDQIEENFQQILEDSEEEGEINESEGGLVHMLEIVGTVLGNEDLLHFISEAISKKLGRKVNISKSAKVIKSIVDIIKNVTGFPAKVFRKFFEWIGKLLGMDKTGSKIMGFVGLGVATTILLAVGIVFFPAASAISGISGVLSVILSISALIGKVTELTVITQEVIAVVRVELNKKVKLTDATEKDVENALGQLSLSI